MSSRTLPARTFLRPVALVIATLMIAAPALLPSRGLDSPVTASATATATAAAEAPLQFAWAQPVSFAVPQKAAALRTRVIRVGLSTRGGNIEFWSASPMWVDDAGEPGRRLEIAAETTVIATLMPTQQHLQANGRIYSGDVQINLPQGIHGAWQCPRLWVKGGPTHVSSDGESPRYERAYHGSFEVTRQLSSTDPGVHKSALRVVNLVSLDDYLRGVVPWEMDADAPAEALKAQAICARSESLAKISAGRHRADGFDICDYDHCQGYSGTENEKPASDRAVHATAGWVLMDGNHIADAVYGTNSGGITSDKNDVWRGGPEPFLKSVRDFAWPLDASIARTVKTHMSEADWAVYCSTDLPSYARPTAAMVAALARRRRRSPATAALYHEGDLPEFYRWTRTVTATELAAAMATRAPAGKLPMEVATDMKVADRAASGHIKKLVVSGTCADGKTTSITLEKDSQVRSMLSGRLGSTTALPSSTFVALPMRDGGGVATSWILKGAGWGHGAGMCQRGAQNHALQGWSARRILGHYFHGLRLKKIG